MSPQFKNVQQRTSTTLSICLPILTRRAMLLTNVQSETVPPKVFEQRPPQALLAKLSLNTHPFTVSICSQYNAPPLVAATFSTNTQFANRLV